MIVLGAFNEAGPAPQVLPNHLVATGEYRSRVPQLDDSLGIRITYAVKAMSIEDLHGLLFRPLMGSHVNTFCLRSRLSFISVTLNCHSCMPLATHVDALLLKALWLRF